MIENQAPQIRDLRENGPENTVDLINSDVKSDHQDQQSPDDRRSSHPSLFPATKGMICVFAGTIFKAVLSMSRAMPWRRLIS